MASRSKERADAAIKAIEKGQEMGIGSTFIDKPASGQARGKIIFVAVDLTDLGSVETFVEDLKR